MSVWKCPHCTSVAIIVGSDNANGCPNLDCRGILDRLDEPDAGAAIRAAFYGHDHGFTAAPAVP